MKLTIATCQFPISHDIEANRDHILRQISEAHRRGAHVAHFPECALSGYAGVEFKSFRDFDWARLKGATREIMAEARRLGLWVILGSSHRLTGRHRPHNSLYVINHRGRMVERYDKRFCTTGDLEHFTSGDHFARFLIRGVRCGLLICHDFRYPELYRAYKGLDVQLVFHSYHNGHIPRAKLRRIGNIWGEITPPTTQAAAASNHLWISATNTSARESCWPAFVARPDGRIAGRLQNNRAGVLITTLDPSGKFYDASEAWRGRAMRGVLHSGTPVGDPRSKARNSI